jgi:hypothetical protein
LRTQSPDRLAGPGQWGRGRGESALAPTEDKDTMTRSPSQRRDTGALISIRAATKPVEKLMAV